MEIIYAIISFMLKLSVIVSMLLLAIVLGYFVYIIAIHDIIEYRKALRDIIPWVESYKSRCTGNNRFVVTPTTLQDAFREYDYEVVRKVWLKLANKKIIEKDPMDNEWVIR